jgi:predicted metal-dependent phosphoesterase TrpH
MKKGINKIEDLAHLSKADLHIHSNHSDGRPSIEEILNYVQDHTDLDVIAISDHDTMDGALEAQELMKQKKYRFELVLSEEISSKEGHILGLFIKEKIRSGMSAHDTLKEIRRQGGVGIAAHPFEHLRYREPSGLTMDGVGLLTLIQEKKLFHGLEVVNATPTLGEENYRAAFVNRTMLLKAETGSSDAHIVEAIGKGYTLFEGKTACDLRNALAHHQTQAMYAKWTIFALSKYLFFFIPIGLRMFLFTTLHGRTEKKVDIVNVPKGFDDQNRC